MLSSVHKLGAKLLIFTVIMAALFIVVPSAQASPAYPVVKTFEQPDGEKLMLRLWGDEFAHGWQTLDGYTVIKNPETGYWEYAIQDRNGELAPSGIVVGEGVPPISKGLRPSLEVINRARAEFGLPPAGEPRLSRAPAFTGPETDVVFVMVEFTDVACTFTDTQMQTNLFGGGASGPGDLDDYFREISYGQLDMVGWVEGGTGCYTAANTHTHYDNGPGSAADLVTEAVNLADPDVDFSIYDNDGDGFVDVFGVIYAGGGPHDGCETDDGADGSADDNLWPHSSSLGAPIAVDGVNVQNYIIQSEITFGIGDGVCDEMQTIGLFAHEFGHAIGLPDLYDTDGSSSGVGWWSAMASQFRSTVNLADTPPHYDPWSKWFEGWITPVDHTGMDVGVSIPQVETNPFVAQFLENPGGAEKGGSGEYFLVENRQQVGFDSQLPGCGLLAWHIDEALTGNQNEGHTAASHRLVDLEEADGQDDLDRDPDTDPAANRGDAGDPFPGSTNNMLWDDNTYPNSRLYSGAGSAVRMQVISTACAPNMLVNFGSPNVDLEISKTAGPNPVIAGEQLFYYINVTNHGPGIASNVEVTDVLPSDVSYQTDDDSCVESFGTLTCTRPSLDIGETWSFKIVVQVNPDTAADAGGPTAIINTATVEADQTDSDPSNNADSVTTIVNELADLRVTKECKPDVPLPAGGMAECTIWVENLGPSSARDVELLDNHISDGTFTFGPVSPGSCSTSPNPQVGSGDVSCTLGDIDPGELVTIHVQLSASEPQDVNDVATGSSETPDPDEDNNTDEDGVNFVSMTDMSLTKTASPNPVTAGSDLTYSLQVTNNGPGTADNVLVEDNLPSGVTIVSVVGTGGASCNAGVPGNSSQPTTCAFGSIPPFGVEDMTIVVTVLPGTTGILHNDAKVSSDAIDLNNTNNLASTDTVVTGDADLSVSIVDHPDPVVAGTKLNYDVTVTNGGPSTAVDVTLQNDLPPEVTFMSATISNGSGTCVLIGSTVDCDLNDLVPGAFVTVFIDVMVDPAVPDLTVIFNTAMVSAATGDSNPANNSETEDTTVSAPEADLEIIKTSNKDTFDPSEVIIYTIAVTNQGPSDALGVVMVDTLPLTPGKVEYIYDNGDGLCAYDEPSHTVTCDFGTLANQESVSVDIHVKSKGSLGWITNSATVTTLTIDPDLSNNTDTIVVRVKGGITQPGMVLPSWSRWRLR
jgi:M6 family metalloprotease-like protein/uncharacterized repeat protein (TIGR01451 family)